MSPGDPDTRDDAMSVPGTHALPRLRGVRLGIWAALARISAAISTSCCPSCSPYPSSGRCGDEEEQSARSAPSCVELEPSAELDCGAAPTWRDAAPREPEPIFSVAVGWVRLLDPPSIASSADQDPSAGGGHTVPLLDGSRSTTPRLLHLLECCWLLVAATTTESFSRRRRRKCALHCARRKPWQRNYGGIVRRETNSEGQTIGVRYSLEGSTDTVYRVFQSTTNADTHCVASVIAIGTFAYKLHTLRGCFANQGAGCRCPVVFAHQLATTAKQGRLIRKASETLDVGSV